MDYTTETLNNLLRCCAAIAGSLPEFSSDLDEFCEAIFN